MFMKEKITTSTICCILLISTTQLGNLQSSSTQVGHSSSSNVEPSGNGATPPYGGILRIGSWAMPQTSMNPLYDTYTSYLPIYNKLMRFDENASMVPDLAYSWNTSSDGLSYTFHLYDNVTWHDGELFTAEDVQFTINTLC